MVLSRHDIESTQPLLLAKLMQREAPDAEWPAEDRKAILQHQLAAPIETDLGSAGLWPCMATGDWTSIQTFGELLGNANPPMALLEATKAFAKQQMYRRRGELPRDVGVVLYYAVIVLAMVHHARRITTLSDKELKAGLEWAMRQEWVDAFVAGILKQGL